MSDVVLVAQFALLFGLLLLIADLLDL